jgi:hypothetical protein
VFSPHPTEGPLPTQPTPNPPCHGQNEKLNVLMKMCSFHIVQSVIDDPVHELRLCLMIQSVFDDPVLV